MAEILLTQGKVAIVDDADYEWLNQWKWYAFLNRQSHIFYAAHGVQVTKNKQRLEYMHRLILGLQRGDKTQTDHRDGNGLNNQRANLRVCTLSQNLQSQRKRRVRTSRYKGVSWNRNARKWRSYISLNGKRTHLGLFVSEFEAARAYDMAAPKKHGDFALTNKTSGL